MKPYRIFVANAVLILACQAATGGRDSDDNNAPNSENGGNAPVVLSVDMGDGTRTITVRLEDV